MYVYNKTKLFDYNVYKNYIVTYSWPEGDVILEVILQLMSNISSAGETSPSFTSS